MNIRPDLEDRDIDGDDDLSIGPKFLREFEELQKHIADSKKIEDSVDATEATGKMVEGEEVEKGEIVKGGSALEKAETKEGEATNAEVKTTNDTESAVKDTNAGVEGVEEKVHPVSDGEAKLDTPDQDEVSKVEEKAITAA